MKANQFVSRIKDDERGFVSIVIGLLVIVIVAGALIGTIGTSSANASANQHTDSTVDIIINLWPLMVIIGVLLYILKIVT